METNKNDHQPRVGFGRQIKDAQQSVRTGNTITRCLWTFAFDKEAEDVTRAGVLVRPWQDGDPVPPSQLPKALTSRQHPQRLA